MGFLGGFGGVGFLEYLMVYSMQLTTNSEVKIYALEKDENSFEALGKLS